ncbi:MAG: hypothetical protein U0K68_07180 [Agathobacter sp.]|nr:hypothetical protein [Agathobacter sp.]
MKMKYTTRNEFCNFEFSEVHIDDVKFQNGVFQMILDDVKILPENSTNRDIRKMRANGLVLTIEDAQINSFVEEGYKTYDANGNLLREDPDVELDEQQYRDIYEFFIDSYAYLIAQNEDEYTFVIDGTNERTYTIIVQGSGDVEEWDKYLQIE